MSEVSSTSCVAGTSLAATCVSGAAISPVACVVGIESLSVCVVTKPTSLPQPPLPDFDFTIEFFLSGAWVAATFGGTSSLGTTQAANLVVLTRVRNTGNNETTVTLTRSGTNFSFSGPSVLAVPLGGSVEFNITFNFTGVAGTYSGTISGTNEDSTKSTTIQVAETVPPPVGIDPSTISSMQARYRADAITGLANGDGVNTWIDISGNSRPMTGSNGNAKYRTNSQNGKPGVETSVATPPDISSVGLSEATATVFAVVKASSGQTANAVLVGMSNSDGVLKVAPTDITKWRTFNNGFFSIRMFTNGIEDATIYANQPKVVAYKASGGSVPQGQFIIGREAGVTTRPCSGIVYELIFYKNVLSEATVTGISQWLANYWGITL